jgi:hypothetical protein
MWIILFRFTLYLKHLYIWLKPSSCCGYFSQIAKWVTLFWVARKSIYIVYTNIPFKFHPLRTMLHILLKGDVINVWAMEMLLSHLPLPGARQSFVSTKLKIDITTWFFFLLNSLVCFDLALFRTVLDSILIWLLTWFFFKSNCGYLHSGSFQFIVNV